MIGFKPIEERDINRIMRTMNIKDEEEAIRQCLTEYWRCEMRMSVDTVEELLDNIVKVWHPENENNWDRLYVEFQDQRSVKICYSYCKHLKDKDTQIMQYFPLQFSEQYRTLNSISYRLRNPADPTATKFKTRIRFDRFGLKLEQKHPAQRNWTRVNVDYLPPVDLQPVPHPVPRDSPPPTRTRQSKRVRSPQQNSPNSHRLEKKGKVAENDTIEEEVPESSYSISNVEKSFQFQNLVHRFAEK